MSQGWSCWARRLVQRPILGRSFGPLGQEHPTENRKSYSRLVSPAEPSWGACLPPSGGQGFSPASHLGRRVGTCRFQDLEEIQGVNHTSSRSTAPQPSLLRILAGRRLRGRRCEEDKVRDLHLPLILHWQEARAPCPRGRSGPSHGRKNAAQCLSLLGLQVAAQQVSLCEGKVSAALPQKQPVLIPPTCSAVGQE